MFLKQTSEYVAGEFPTGKLTRRSPEALTKSPRVSMPHPAHPATCDGQSALGARGSNWADCGHEQPAAPPLSPPRERAKVQRPQVLAVKLKQVGGLEDRIAHTAAPATTASPFRVYDRAFSLAAAAAMAG